MAEAALDSLLDNLKQLLLYHTRLINDAKDSIEKLERGLRLFKAFLRNTDRNRRKDDDTLSMITNQIRDIVYEAEDTIDTFVSHAAKIKSKTHFFRAFAFVSPVNLQTIVTKVDEISRRVRDKDYHRIKFHFDRSESSKQLPLVREENVVGFEYEAEKIKGYLFEKTNELDVISITGMPGIGKTTLAWKIFHDKIINYEFPTRIWVSVSQEFSKKDVYLAILREFTRTDDMYQKSEQELGQIVYGHLKRGKILLVMDDVWTTSDWDEINVALPKGNGGCKVMITTRDEQVTRHASKLRAPLKLSLLTPSESWLLLQLEVFGKLECPSELEYLGKLIADKCSGLPLAIVVIGSILVKKSLTLDNMKSAWEKVLGGMDIYLNEDPERRLQYLIGLSYEKLPYHLRACFLYLGMFPEDYEIPVRKLVCMWIAEGFIQQKDGISLEETAENYLDELIDRNLVRVDRRRSDGKVKSCRIHDMLRDFCKNEAGSERENFLQEIRMAQEGSWPIDEVKKYRRICIHSNVVNFISCKPDGAHVRSFVCFAKEDITLPVEHTSAIPAGFELLRVLDVRPLKFTKIPRNMYDLVHLRYIVLSLDASILPAAFAKLWNIQTLIVDTTSHTLEIKADVWKLSQLRHLKTNASATLPKPANGKEGKKLQSLGTISPKCCTEDVFGGAHNLKKLGIRGKLALLLEGNTASYDNLGKLNSLEKLKLINDVFPNAVPECPSLRLPPPYKFPRKLRRLTLEGTFFEWSVDMPTLGLLENLQKLKLKNNAFKGNTWKVTAESFGRLEVLHIGRTDLTEWIMASSHHFPRLRHLELHNCEELKEIPLSLAEVPSFQHLELYHSVHAEAAAKKIQKAKQEKQAQDTKDSEFKLSISY